MRDKVQGTECRDEAEERGMAQITEEFISHVQELESKANR